MDPRLPLILVVCTGSSCRSQMAHAFLALTGGARVGSAGSSPSGYVHPYAIQVMLEKGNDLSKAKSQHIEKFDKNDIAVVVAVSSNARDNCPYMASTLCYHWEFEDPVDTTDCEVVFLSRLDQLVPLDGGLCTSR
jgi:arsenate reductase (thioredoxin)